MLMENIIYEIFNQLFFAGETVHYCILKVMRRTYGLKFNDLGMFVNCIVTPLYTIYKLML